MLLVWIFVDFFFTISIYDYFVIYVVYSILIVVVLICVFFFPLTFLYALPKLFSISFNYSFSYYYYHRDSSFSEWIKFFHSFYAMRMHQWVFEHFIESFCFVCYYCNNKKKHLLIYCDKLGIDEKFFFTKHVVLSSFYILTAKGPIRCSKNAPILQWTNWIRFLAQCQKKKIQSFNANPNCSIWKLKKIAQHLL